MSQPVTTAVEDSPTSPQQEIPANQQQEQQQQQQQQNQSLNQQETQPHADVGPIMPQPTQRSNTVNQIPTDSELEQQGNTEAQTNAIGYPIVPKAQQEQQQQQSDFPIDPRRPLQTANQQQEQQQQQQQAVTAPKPKADHSQTDATIQGLLVQVIALQHNKIQQISQQEQQQ